MAFIALLVPLCAPAADVDALLQEADQVRSSDPTRFSALLRRLDRHPESLDAAQKRHLRLLHGYRALREGEHGVAIATGRELHADAPEPELRFRGGLLVANTAAITRDFTLGLRYLERALQLEPQLTDRGIRHMGWGVAGVLYNQYGQFALGKHFADRLMADKPEGRMRCFAGELQIEAAHGLGLPQPDEARINRAIADCIAQGEPIPANRVRGIWAQWLAARGEYQRAIALLEPHIAQAEGTGYNWLVAEMHAQLAQCRLELGEIEAAAMHARHVVALPGHDFRWRPRVVAHHVLYEAALRKGQYLAALKEYRQYAEAEKARMDDVRAREYAFQVTRHELNRKDHSIAELSTQNQVLRLQQEVAQRSAWNLRLALALLVVVTGSAMYWGWRARRTHRALQQLADTDSLTGLSNRRHFRATAEAALAQCQALGRPVSVLLFDLDHFKQINDQCGHSAGDWVLREVARAGRQHCRQGDVFGRIGGEEFALALPDCDADGALRIAEGCRRSIEAIDARSGAGCGLPVAASIGVVATSISGYDYEALVAHADAAMYRSKVAGRNRVTLYRAPPVPAMGRLQLDASDSHGVLRAP